jgi:intracellular septation protein A
MPMNSSLLLLGFLPVIAFLLMDTYGGKRTALLGALVLGCLEAAYTVAMFGALDYLSLVAFLILGAFVVASLRTQDDFFFKIHGAVTNVLMAVVMLIAFHIFHRAMLLDGANKYLELDKMTAAYPQLDKETVSETFRVLSYQLPWWLVLHSLLTVHAAANWSKWAWGFVRIPGLIIMLFLASIFAEATVFKGR